MYGVALHRCGRHEDALARLLSALEKDARLRHGHPYFVAGETLLALSRWDDSVDAFERYLDFNGSDVAAHTQLARAYAGSKDTAEARKWLVAGIASWHGLSGAFGSRGASSSVSFQMPSLGTAAFKCEVVSDTSKPGDSPLRTNGRHLHRQTCSPPVEIQLELGQLDRAERIRIGAHAGQAIAQASLQRSHRLPFETVDRVAHRMRLRDHAARELFAGALIVALRTRQIELSDALPEQFFTMLDMRRDTRIVATTQGSKARSRGWRRSRDTARR